MNFDLNCKYNVNAVRSSKVIMLFIDFLALYKDMKQVKIKNQFSTINSLNNLLQCHQPLSRTLLLLDLKFRSIFTIRFAYLYFFFVANGMGASFLREMHRPTHQLFNPSPTRCKSR